MPFLDKLRSAVIKWDAAHPYDLWWRRKYKVAFGSEAHKNMNFIDMVFEYEEEKLLNELRATKEEKQDTAENEVLGIDKTVKKIVPLSKEQIDQEFEDLDISKYNTANVGQENKNIT